MVSATETAAQAVRIAGRRWGAADRRLSLILYLNEHWQAGAGGELEVFDARAGYRP